MILDIFRSEKKERSCFDVACYPPRLYAHVSMVRSKVYARWVSCQQNVIFNCIYFSGHKMKCKSSTFYFYLSILYIYIYLIVGGHSTFFGLLNTFVHIIMYTYYLLSAFGPRIRPYLWWKKYLTTLQMVNPISCLYLFCF